MKNVNFARLMIALRDLIRYFQKYGIDFVIIGGSSLIIHEIIEEARDVDIVILNFKKSLLLRLQEEFQERSLIAFLDEDILNLRLKAVDFQIGPAKKFGIHEPNDYDLIRISDMQLKVRKLMRTEEDYFRMLSGVGTAGPLRLSEKDKDLYRERIAKIRKVLEKK